MTSVNCEKEDGSQTKVAYELSKFNAEELRLCIEMAKEMLKSKKLKPKPNIHTKGRVLFINIYKEIYHCSYYYTGKDAQGCKLLLAKIKNKLLESQLIVDENTILTSFEIFIRRTYALRDEWINSHFTLSVIDSQFNVIYTRLKTNSNGKSISPDYKSKVLRDILA